MDEQEINKTLEVARKFLKENKPEQEPDYFVDRDGNLIECPEGMTFDYEADSLKFKKEK
jgi:hypothetical protein